MSAHADRIFPADAPTREIARVIYESVADAPIVSPHGHVDPRLLLDNEAFPDPAALLISSDHYVLRLLHALGHPLDELGVPRTGQGHAPADGRKVWRVLCNHWSDLAGTPVRLWLESQLTDLFGVDRTPAPATADAIYDELAAALATLDYRPRALYSRFGISVLATTDDPADDLAAHKALRDDPTFSGNVIPTFRADRYMQPDGLGWASALDQLAVTADVDCATHEGLLEALRSRRAEFARLGATSTDTGVADAGCEPLPFAEAERIHRAARDGEVTVAEADAYRRHMLYQLAAMSAEDGLVMQLHAGILRNHHTPSFQSFGPDRGHDLPLPTEFTRSLRPILRDFGLNPTFRIVLFTTDETAFSRDIAPLAGFYPSVYAGAPWWFLDSPAGIARYRDAITDSAGYTKTSGFIDDTRAFCSIQARHDMARRADATHLATHVATSQLGIEEARAIAARIVGEIPRATFRLNTA